jgi:hypothetical protein
VEVEVETETLVHDYSGEEVDDDDDGDDGGDKEKPSGSYEDEPVQYDDSFEEEPSHFSTRPDVPTLSQVDIPSLVPSDAEDIVYSPSLVSTAASMSQCLPSTELKSETIKSNSISEPPLLVASSSSHRSSASTPVDEERRSKSQIPPQALMQQSSNGSDESRSAVHNLKSSPGHPSLDKLPVTHGTVPQDVSLRSQEDASAQGPPRQIIQSPKQSLPQHTQQEQLQHQINYQQHQLQREDQPQQQYLQQQYPGSSQPQTSSSYPFPPNYNNSAAPSNAPAYQYMPPNQPQHMYPNVPQPPPQYSLQFQPNPYFALPPQYSVPYQPYTPNYYHPYSLPSPFMQQPPSASPAQMYPPHTSSSYPSIPPASARASADSNFVSKEEHISIVRELLLELRAAKDETTRVSSQLNEALLVIRSIDKRMQPPSSRSLRMSTTATQTDK